MAYSLSEVCLAAIALILLIAFMSIVAAFTVKIVMRIIDGS